MGITNSSLVTHLSAAMNLPLAGSIGLLKSQEKGEIAAGYTPEANLCHKTTAPMAANGLLDLHSISNLV